LKPTVTAAVVAVTSGVVDVRYASTIVPVDAPAARFANGHLTVFGDVDVLEQVAVEADGA
jgi:hypothetical protein